MVNYIVGTGKHQQYHCTTGNKARHAEVGQYIYEENMHKGYLDKLCES